MSSSRRWLPLLSFSLALAFGHGCSCTVGVPGVDGGDPIGRDSGIDPKPPEDGGSDAGQDDDAGQTESDAGEDAGPNLNDAGQDAGSGDDGGPIDDDAGETDAGPNAVPTIGSFTTSADTLDDPGSVTLTVDANDDDGDTLSYTYTVVGTRPAGLTFDPAGPTNDATTTVSFDGSVPRGSYTLEVEVSDGEGSATATVTVTVNNHAPTLTADDITLLPESPAASVTLSPVIGDVDLDATPADTLTVGWVVAGSLPAGITFEASDPLAPTVTVDRATYAPDPSQVGFSFTVTVGVSDDQDASAVATVTITVLDERGGHVDNTSPYAGTGPTGYCGSRAHPCATIADAQTNLASLRGADDTVPNEILVATTGTDYALDATLALDPGTALRCGFDADAVDSVTGEWTQTAERTPLRSTADTGIVLSDPDMGDAVSLIERCDLEMLDQATDAADRVGVLILGAGATLDDNRVVGATSENGNGVAVAVSGAGTAAVKLTNNDLAGGAATNDVAGVALVGRGAELTGNTIRGGTGADRAAGVIVENAHVTMTDNAPVVGGSADLAIGLILGAGVDGSVITGNELTGTEATAGLVAYGAIVRAGAALTGNELRSGESQSGVGLLVDAATNVTSIDDVIAGEGTLTATGLVAEADATVTLTGAEVSAPGNGNPLVSIGVQASDAAAVTLVDSTVDAGNATNTSIGVQGDTGAESMTLTGTHVTSGNATAAFSVAVAVVSGALVIEGSDAVATPILIAGEAEANASMGVSVDCSSGATDVDINGASITTSAAAISLGVRLAGCAGATLSNATVVSGPANSTGAADTGSAAALLVEGGTATVRGGSYTGGPSDVTSAGAVIEGAVVGMVDVTSTGGAVQPADATLPQAVSAGVVFLDAGAGNTLTGVTATGGPVGPATLSHSYGVIVANDAGVATVAGFAVDGGTLTGGDADDRSAGLWIEPPFTRLAVSGSVIVGARGGSSGGLVLRGDGSGAVIDENTLLAGEAGDVATIDGVPISVGLWMGTCEGCSVQRNVIEGASVEATNGRSLGLRVASRSVTTTSYVTNNVIEAGDALIARGIELSGDAGDTLRVLHNNIFGGGSGALGSESAAVYMGQVQPANSGLVGRHTVASFGGNLIDPGLGDTRVGFWETCVDHGAVAHTVEAEEARNSNFWPRVADAADIVYVRDASAAGIVITGQSCASADLKAIADVNAAADYGATSDGTCTSESYDRNPGFTDGRDIGGITRAGTHIAADSELRGTAPGTYANDGCTALTPLWEGAADMVDFDGEARPNPAADALDIGADEVP